MGEQSRGVRYVMRSKQLGAFTYEAVRVRVGHNLVLVEAVSPTSKVPHPVDLEAAVNVVLLNLSM